MRESLLNVKCDLSLPERNRQTTMGNCVGPVLWGCRRSILGKDDLRIRHSPKFGPIGFSFSALSGSAATMLSVHDLLPYGLK